MEPRLLKVSRRARLLPYQARRVGLCASAIQAHQSDKEPVCYPWQAGPFKARARFVVCGGTILELASVAAFKDGAKDEAELAAKVHKTERG